MPAVSFSSDQYNILKMTKPVVTKAPIPKKSPPVVRIHKCFNACDEGKGAFRYTVNVVLNVEGRHIDIRKLTHRSSKVDASIFEDRRRKHRTYNSSSNIAHNCAPKSLEWTKLHTLIRTCIKINNNYLIYSNGNTRVTPHVH